MPPNNFKLPKFWITTSSLLHFGLFFCSSLSPLVLLLERVQKCLNLWSVFLWTISVWCGFGSAAVHRVLAWHCTEIFYHGSLTYKRKEKPTTPKKLVLSSLVCAVQLKKYFFYVFRKRPSLARSWLSRAFPFCHSILMYHLRSWCRHRFTFSNFYRRKIDQTGRHSVTAFNSKSGCMRKLNFSLLLSKTG